MPLPRWLLRVIAPIVLPFMSSSFRTPSRGFLGWMAQQYMKTSNKASIQAAMERLDLQPTDVFVEIGAGHGVGFQAALERKPRRIVMIELSKSFRKKLTAIANKVEGPYRERIEIYDTDAKDTSAFLQPESVDKMLAVNVVYFLDPLEEYLKEIWRVLKPGGTIVWGCKFNVVKNMDEKIFVNQNYTMVEETMQKIGFEVVGTDVELNTRWESYTEIAGLKPVPKAPESF